MEKSKITVKLTSPRDYEITKDGAIMVVRTTRVLYDDALGKPLREYEEILKFIENFEVCNVKPNYNFIIKSTEEQHPIKTVTKEEFLKTQKEVDEDMSEINKLLPSSQDISRIEEKYSNIPNPAERRAHIIKNISDMFTAEDIAKVFDGNGNNRNQLLQGAYRDIHYLLNNNRIKYIKGSNPKRYLMINREIP